MLLNKYDVKEKILSKLPYIPAGPTQMNMAERIPENDDMMFNLAEGGNDGTNYRMSKLSSRGVL